MIKLIHNACPFFFDAMDDCLILQLLQVSVTMMVIFWIFLKKYNIMNILRRFYSTTMSYGPKYIVVYYFFEKIFCRLLCFRSSGICQFTHMDKPHFYFACQLACLDEWKEKPLGTQNTNETENASTHAVSEMISFNIFPFQFTGVLPDVTLLTGHFIFPDFEPEQSHGSTKSRWSQVTVFW